ncbi:MAG: hypothetical protein Q8L14_04985 [Myxococcales bacterium]|nr:hypothetical protein [Myxococcales bacterium]
MRLALLLIVLSQPALADFTLVSEATVDGRQQLTTISLRGTMLRVLVETGKTPTVLFLRDTASGVTVVSEPAENSVQRIVDVPDPAVAPSGDRLGYRFERQPSKRRLLGRECIDHLATASSPELSFSGCYAPWSAVGLDAVSFGRLFPSSKTMVWFPRLVLMTMTWMGVHPSFAGELPGVPLERSQLFWNGPTRKVGSRVKELRPTALDASLFAWPTIPDAGTR